MKISKTQSAILEKVKRTIEVLSKYKNFTDFLIIRRATSNQRLPLRQLVTERGIVRKYGARKTPNNGRNGKEITSPPSMSI